MPELPEVETVANGVDARVRGQRIVRVWTSGKPQTFKSPESEIVETLTGAWIERVRRVGKTIVMDLRRGEAARDREHPAIQPMRKSAHGWGTQRVAGVEESQDRGLSTAAAKYAASGRDDTQKSKGNDNGCDKSGDKQILRSAQDDNQKDLGAAQFLVHLGMTGRLLVSQAEVAMPLHTHAVLSLADGREVRFVDPRRFGRLSVVTEVGGYAGPGAEPTTISVEGFSRLFKGRKLAIKAALLNQSILHGVGNIYADESLFRAGIRPQKQAGKLTKAELARLHVALQQVLAHAIELGGSSVSDYVDADGVRGFFQLEHKVYGRAGEDCHDCGAGLKKIVVGGRTTVYCPRCQR